MVNKDMLKPIYFWTKDNRLLTTQVPYLQAHVAMYYEGMFCVDTHVPVDTPAGRYGMYKRANEHSTRTLNWDHIPLADFPAEFQMNLLLLGVP